MTDTEPTPVLAAHDIHKRYASGTIALHSVNLVVQPGTVHALVGANGAGKSTLVKVLAGVESPTAGQVVWRGENVQWSSPSQALEAGLGAVHQHTPLATSMSVLDNVFLGQGGSLRWNARKRKADLVALLERIDYFIDPDEIVDTLSVGARQMVAILQALERNPALILMDEPTASLSASERQVLFRVIRTLRAQGTSFVYISHFLDEIMDLSDHMTVLRDGRVVLDCPTPEITKDGLIIALVGERLHQLEAAATPNALSESARPLLEVTGLRPDGGLGPIDLTVHAGEVVGLAGLLGSGRSEILHAIFGSQPSTGTVSVDGEIIKHRNPRRAIRAGIALVPEDRLRQGLMTEWEIWRNISLPYLSHRSWGRIIPRHANEVDLAAHSIAELSIKTESIDKQVNQLSGGNAQKVMISKWLNGPARIFLLDEPGAGVDIGAKADIIQIVRKLAGMGHGVIVVDSEFEELLAICDRVLVIRRGKIVDECFAGSHDVQHLTAMASGLS